MREHDELDFLINSALSTYAEPDAEPGLEDRILARIAADGVPLQRRRWLPWAIALPIAAGLLVLLVLSAYRQKEPQLAQHLQVPLTQQTEVANAGRELSTIHRRENAGGGLRPPHTRGNIDAGRAVLLPKREVFPTPKPLSPEEQAFVEFAAKAPETDRKLFIEAQKRDDAPLSIAAIEIQPLDPPSNGDN